MADFWTLATKVVDADIGKFTIFFLMVFFILQDRDKKKTQSQLIKFITDRMDGLERLIAESKDVFRSKLDETKIAVKEDVKNAMDFAIKTRNDLLIDIELCRQKIEEYKKILSTYGEENSMVVKLLAEEKELMEQLKSNYNRFWKILQERSDKKQ